DLPLSRSSSIASSRLSWSMEPALPPLECLDCSTEHLTDHALRCCELTGEPIIPRSSPDIARPWRQRRQQARLGAELAAQPGRPPHRTRDTLRAIAELMAHPARDFIVVHVQMPAQRSTPRTHPVGLLAVDALLSNNPDHLLDPVDKQRDLLARDASMR